MGLMLLLLASTVLCTVAQVLGRPVDYQASGKSRQKGVVLSFLFFQCLRQIWLCRGSVAAAKTKSALAAVFDLAPHCIDAKLLQAEMMLDDKDYGGVQICLTPLHLLVC